MVIALALAAVGAVASLVTTAGVITLQKREALESNERAAKLENETAQARLQLEQLQKQVGPRNLNWNAFVEVIKSEEQLPVEILYVADDADSMELAQQIQLAISAAGWKMPLRNPIQRPTGWSEPLAMAEDGQPKGVTIVANSKTPTGALERALGAGLGKYAMHIQGAHAPPVGTLRIVVAPRI